MQQELEDEVIDDPNGAEMLQKIEDAMQE